MKFDVIVGNPPYQLSDAGHGRSASPIYHKFIEQAKKLNPRYLTMIIPARWYAGGKGLDDFRAEMLADKRIRKLVDFENSNDVFPGVDVAGGVCYFLWDRDNKGNCEVTNFINGEQVKSVRDLNEFPIFIRHSQAIPIIRKVQEKENAKFNLDVIVSPSKPFGLRGHHKPSKSGIPCYFTQRQGVLFVKKEDITDNYKLLDKYKLLIPRAPIAGQTDFSKPVGFYYEGNVRIAKPGEACTESWLVAFASKQLKEVEYFKTYLFTKIFRFLLLQTVVSQDVTRDKFKLVPHLGKYEGIYTDKQLIERWGITNDEWKFIDSRIKDISANENDGEDE
jgi:site-specific DNA-methyltransferase (adenine-specific)